MRWLGLWVAGLLACTADNPAFGGETESTAGSTTMASDSAETTSVETTADADSSTGVFTCDDIEQGEEVTVEVNGASSGQICGAVNVSGNLVRSNGEWQIVCNPECNGVCEDGPYTLNFGNDDPVFVPSADACVLAFGSYDANCRLSFMTITENSGQVIHYAAGTARSIDDPLVSSFLVIEPVPLRTCECEGTVPECCRRMPGTYALHFEFLSIDETLEQGQSVVVDGGGHDLTLRNLQSHVLPECNSSFFDWVAMP